MHTHANTHATSLRRAPGLCGAKASSWSRVLGATGWRARTTPSGPRASLHGKWKQHCATYLLELPCCCQAQNGVSCTAWPLRHLGHSEDVEPASPESGGFAAYKRRPASHRGIAVGKTCMLRQWKRSLARTLALTASLIRRLWLQTLRMRSRREHRITIALTHRWARE
jgi:hypothetical protein